VTMPTGPGQRNNQLFGLARYLRVLMPDAQHSDLQAILQRWHRRALPVIRTKDFCESWKDFQVAWFNVRAAPISLASVIERADVIPTPELALTFDNERIRKLVRICASLQEHWGDRPFFLGAREAAMLVGVDKSTVWRWVQAIEKRGILCRIRTGRQATRKATEWRYLGGQPTR
jgi:hypothetical protein